MERPQLVKPSSRKGFAYSIALVAMVALFFFLCLPLLPSVSRWRGDERFYTDAVIAMTQNGDYFTPTYSDGMPRFKKPILSYWVVLLSYKALGINYLASRLPFLAAGTLVVWLTYHLGIVLTRRRPEALVAAAIMVSNLTVFHTAVRSTPDMLLTLFILISMIGFSRLIFRGSRGLADYILAWLGIALAVATKGLFGLLPAAFALGYVRLARPRQMRAGDLVHGPVIAATLPVALAWFVWAFVQHGGAAATDFWGDQVGSRLSGGKWYILDNAGTYLASFVLQLLPWSGFALVPLYQVARKRLVVYPLHRQEAVFMAGWLMVLYVVFVFGNIQRTRYFLPAYPQLSLLYAGLLCAGFRNRRIRNVLKVLFKSVVMGVLGWGVILIAGGIGIDARLMIAGLVFAALSSGLLAVWRRWAASWLMAGVGILLLGLYGVGDILVRPVFFESPAPGLTAQLLALEPAGTSVAMMGVPLPYISQLRVLSGGRITPVDVADTNAPACPPGFRLLVCSRNLAESGPFSGGEVVGRVTGMGNWRVRDYLALLSPARRDAAWATRREEYVVVRRQDPSCAGPGKNPGASSGSPLPAPPGQFRDGD